MMKTEELNDCLTAMIVREGTFENALSDALDILKMEDEEREAAESEVMKREAMMPTVIAQDAVLPRAEIKRGFSIAAGVSRHSIAHPNSQSDIRYFALFLYSQEYREDFLNYLAYFTRLFLQRSFKLKLAAAKDEDEIKTLIIEGIEEIED